MSEKISFEKSYFSTEQAKEVSDFVCRVFLETDPQVDIEQFKNEFLSLYTPENITQKWGHDYVLLFRNNGMLVGIGRAKENGWITHCYVEPIYHKKGLGTAIMKDLIEWFKIKNIREIFLNSENHNLGFYKKLGFSVREEKLEHGAKHYLLYKKLT